jgi:crotonobetainyl-CoA:carnitine CoA-transferase CaiB-like acyl-CoA transferase
MRVTTALDGIRVLDATTGVAGAYCAKLLHDLGADVVLVEPPGGAPLRRWSATGSAGRDGHADGAFFRFLRAGQRSIDDGDDDLVDHLVAGADIVLGLDPERVRRHNPAAIAVGIDAFGAGSPRAGDEPGDFLLQALSGSLSARGAQDGSPVYVNEGGGQVGEYIAGMFAAAGALAALAGQRRTGAGDALEVATLEAQALCLVNYPTVTASYPYQNAETVRWLSIPGVEPCADGYVGFFVVTGQQWLDFLTMIERPDLGEDEELLTMPGRMARKDELLPIIRAWTGARTAREITELAALFRVPAALIGQGDTMPGFDHLVERGSFTTNPEGGFVQPASPFRMSGAERVPIGPAPGVGADTGAVDWSPRSPGPERSPGATPAAADGVAAVTGAAGGTGQADGRPLDGLRVLDLTTFWAGPIATQLLAALGADVVRVESIQRPDPQRYNTRVPRTEPQWYETAPVFNAPNLNKREVTLNLSGARGREVFEQLLGTADLVVENYTPRVLDNFGLTWDHIHAVNPRAILVRMPAFGLDGPWRDRPGFAQTVSQAGGMCWTTGPAIDPPMNPGPVCDPLAGIHAMTAALAAVEQRRRTGEGQLVEVPMIDVVLNVTAEQTIEHSAYGRLLIRHGNRGPHAAPQGAYRCGPDDADDWVAIAVATDAQWQALAKVVGEPGGAGDWTSDPALATAEGRHAADAADRIDVELARWCGARDAATVLDALRSAGVPAEPVVPAHLADRQELFAARGYFEEVDHPVVGPKRYPSLPFRLASHRGPWFTRPAPLLGQHNDEVLAELGFDADGLARLRDEQVIGEVPLGL